MKSSDVVPMPNTARNFLAESLCDRNASHVHSFPHWSETSINVPLGAAESTPRCFGRDSAIADSSRRKRLHAAMDKMCSDAGLTEEEGQRFHKSLDAKLDEQEARGPEGEEEVEEELDEEDPDWRDDMEQERETRGDKALDALLYRVLGTLTGDSEKTSRSKDDGRIVSYATDSDFISRHLNPNLLCSEAAKQLYGRAWDAQTNSPNRGYWTGLIAFLKNAPKSAKVRDLNQVQLSELIGKTLAA